MADVFKGRVQGPAGFERVFVVKRILPHLSDDPQFNKMFVEEAKLSARLNHPNIVQVFELGSVDGEYFISMEYVRGRDLAETMRTLWARIGPPRPELVAYVGREMCRALAYAHDLVGDDGQPIGMIHRDVSPSNVMLSYEGAVKLLDFGIAKALGGDQSDEGNTARGTLKGKFAYMAPEQTQGSDVDRRIDVFATGIVLHEILTGRRLFKGENDLQTVEKVRQCDVPPPSLQNPLCPPELDAIVLRALARNRDHRFQTAHDMADALDDIVHATRFQPTHLAQLMRDLFPGEAGVDPRATTGSVRISQTMTGSSSRPYSGPVRSPTIPPVSVSRSSGAAHQVEAAPAPPAPPPRSSWQRRSLIWGGLIVGAGLAFGAGHLLNFMSTTKTPVLGPGRVIKEGPVQVVVDSIPTDGEIVEKTTGRVLGRTPQTVTVTYKADAPPVLIIRKVGYQPVEKEVNSTFRVFASLRAAPPNHGREAPRDRPGGERTGTAPPERDRPERPRSDRSPPPTSGGAPIIDDEPTAVADTPSAAAPSSGRTGSGSRGPGRHRSGAPRGTSNPAASDRPASGTTDLVNPF